MNLMKAISQYLEYLEIEKGRSRKTIENYNQYLKKLVDFLEKSFDKKKDNISVQKIDAETIRKYRLYLNRINDGGLKKATQNYYIIALRGFLRYLVKIGQESLSPDNIELSKLPEREIEMISYSDLERLLSAPDGNDIISIRDRAILETIFSTGMRISELCSLKKENVNLKTGEFSVFGKGGKIRVVFLSKIVRELIKKYLDKRGDLEDSLFVSYSKANNPRVLGGISPRLVQRLIKHYATKAGIVRKVTPHTLRHMFATDLLQNGADLRSVQMMLGHSNLNTTQVYTHLTNKELKEVHSAFHNRRRK